MRFDIMTLFPDLVQTVLSESIIGRAQKSGVIEIHTHNIRDYAENKHNRVDDTPYGGGMGMLMAAPPIYRCAKAITDTLPAGQSVHTVYLSPRGRLFDHKVAKELAAYDNLILLCGHYEGVDARVLETVV
ncbi:MAG: tRNA (guanosine(37)-N1)-methyltransferase TrmD, partial [Clostridia bacterium]|nr:tRNA (guanosine(37)-N1)-methyltransferase TrmD [Clostridia bacterium]